MLIVLPPSETKAPGGVDAPMSLSFPSLDPVRTVLLDALSHTPVEAPASKQDEAEENFTLRAAPVMPAIVRYTGVLYDALDPATLPDAARSHLAVGSALFGLVRAGDLIPRYRLSAGTKLGGTTMRARWGPAVTDVLAEQGFVVDMRSGAYRQLGPAPGAVTVRVEQADTGKVVSHFNKRYKGELARVLAAEVASASKGSVTPVGSVFDVADLAAGAGFRVEVRGNELVLLV